MRDSLSAIHQAVQFIDSHLQDDVTVADIASAAGYSLFHFVRTFNKVTHHTPYDYLMRRRLSEAALALAHSERKIIDIALDFCFHSPEVFSRAFKRMFHLQPSQYRNVDVVDPRFVFSPKTLPYLQYICEGDLLLPSLIQRQPVKVFGLMIRMDAGRQGVRQLWESLEHEISDLKALPRYGIYTYTDDWQKNGGFYMAAVELEISNFEAPALVMRSLPAGEYAAFNHQGSLDNLVYTQDFIYQTWLPKSGMRLAQPLEIDFYAQNMEDNTPSQVLIAIQSL